VITAVDTNVLLDVFGASPDFGTRSREAVRTCSREGRLVACPAVWAEVSASFPSARASKEALDRLGVDYSPQTEEAALAAGAAWRVYRAAGGKRTRVIADFLIAAHALTAADRLLTRDRGFYPTYFRRLRILDPAASK
jgi:predicted nucleic acid-binding protein